MTRGILTLATLLVSTAAAATAAPAPERAADTAAIRAHIDAIFDAYRTRDRAALRATHAKDWRGFIRPSKGIVRGIDEYMRDAEKALSFPGRLKSHEMVDFDVKYRGDTALVSYIARIQWEQDGTLYPDVIRVLDVYARERGHWNQIGSLVATDPSAAPSSSASTAPRTLSEAERRQLLADREEVWRAFFAGDTRHLEKILPADFIAIGAGTEEWPGRAEILAASAGAASDGVKLVKLEFPRTEIRVHGDVAVLYTTYLYELETPDGRRTHAGRGTEIFVQRDGRWAHPGWHLDSGR